jgi:hypothetical protein
MRRGRKPGGGKEGAWIALGRVLAERRENMPGLEDSSRSQNGFAKRLGISQAFLGQVERGFKNLANYSLSWFEKNAPSYGWTTEEMLEALGLEAVDGKVRAVHRAWDGTHSLEERTVRFARVPFHSGSDETILPTQGDGEVWLEDDGFTSKHPNGYYFRIGDPCMEPHFPEQWYAAIVPDSVLAHSRMPVLVWLSNGSRVVRYLVLAEKSGEHILYQPNPPLGERRIVYAPKGSRILGVVVDVKRAIEPNRVPRLSSREIAAVLAEEMPELLEAVDF